MKEGKTKTWENVGISKTTYYRKKDAYEAELAARREAEAAKKQQISDARFIASETAFRGMRDAAEIGYRNNTRKILAEELEAMSVEAFYELHSKKKIAGMRKRKAAHKAAKKDDGTVVVDFSDVVMRHTLARIAAG